MVRVAPLLNFAVQQPDRVSGSATATLEDAKAATVKTAMLPAAKIDVRMFPPPPTRFKAEAKI